MAFFHGESACFSFFATFHVILKIQGHRWILCYGPLFFTSRVSPPRAEAEVGAFSEVESEVKAEVEAEQAAIKQAVTQHTTTLARIEQKLDNPKQGPSLIALGAFGIGLVSLVGSAIVGFVILTNSPQDEDLEEIRASMAFDDEREEREVRERCGRPRAVR